MARRLRARQARMVAGMRAQAAAEQAAGREAVTCPECNGTGADPNDPETAQGGAPHAECRTCWGTGWGPAFERSC